LRHDLEPSGPTKRERHVRGGVGWVLVAAVAGMLVTGCGGSGGSQTVNGCAIEAGTSCPGADLSGADLSGSDLSRADLTGANLDGANLSNSGLSEANLSNAQMTGTNLSDADLTSANLTGATISDTDLEGATLCGTTRTDGTTDDSDCPASTETTGTETTESTTTEAGAAEVTSFEVGDLKCGAATTAPVAVTWATTNATAVEIGVDSFSPQGFGPSGTTNVVVPCDDESHTITITPQSDAGTGEPETTDVSAS
jgi:pentapeptide repeat protein